MLWEGPRVCVLQNPWFPHHLLRTRDNPATDHPGAHQQTDSQALESADAGKAAPAQVSPAPRPTRIRGRLLDWRPPPVDLSPQQRKWWHSDTSSHIVPSPSYTRKLCHLWDTGRNHPKNSAQCSPRVQWLLRLCQLAEQRAARPAQGPPLTTCEGIVLSSSH